MLHGSSWSNIARMAREMKHGWEITLCVRTAGTGKNLSHHRQIRFTCSIHANLLLAF